MPALRLLFVARRQQRWRDLESRFLKEGRLVEWASDASGAVDCIRRNPVAAVLADDESFDAHLLSRLRRVQPDVPVLLLTTKSRRPAKADACAVLHADEDVDLIADTILHLIDLRRLTERFANTMGETQRLCRELRVHVQADPGGELAALDQILAILIPDSGGWESPFACPVCRAGLSGQRRSARLILSCPRHGPIHLRDLDHTEEMSGAVIQALTLWEEKIRFLQQMARGARERGRDHIAASFALDAAEAQNRVQRIVRHLQPFLPDTPPIQ